MTVDVFWNDVKIAANHHRNVIGSPQSHLPLKSIHPGKLVFKIVAAHRIPVRKVDIRDAYSINRRLEKSRVRVRTVASEARANRLDWVSRQYCDTVICLLCDSHTVVAQCFEDIRRKFLTF